MSIFETITVSIAVMAFISPIITSIVDNRYKIKLRKLEISETRKNEIYSNYLNHVGKYIAIHNTLEDFYKYKGYLAEAYLYAPKEVWPVMEQLDLFISNNNYSEAANLLSEVAKNLNVPN